MNFVQGMGVGVVDDFLAAYVDIAARWENIDRVLHAAHARLGQFVERLISLLIFSLDALHVFGSEKRIQYFGVVPDPASAGGKGQQRESRGGFPPRTKPQGCVAAAVLPSVLLPTRPKRYRGDGQQHAEKQPIEREPVPRQTIGSIAEEIRINNVGPSRKLNEVCRHVQGLPEISVHEIVGDENEIPHVLVGRQDVDKKSQNREKDEPSTVSHQQFGNIKTEQ